MQRERERERLFPSFEFVDEILLIVSSQLYSRETFHKYTIPTPALTQSNTAMLQAGTSLLRSRDERRSFLSLFEMETLFVKFMIVAWLDWTNTTINWRAAERFSSEVNKK